MPEQSDYRYEVFVSFAAGDRDWVEGYLLPALALPSGRVITNQPTSSSESFQLGADVVDEFERAVTSSRFTLLVLSCAYLNDKWSVFGERLASYAAVAEQRNRLIPLLRERDCTLPLHIEFRVRLDCSEQSRWEAEIGRLRQLLAQPEPKPERIPCPYPGMVPFQEKDARFFYGREGEIGQMLLHFRNQRLLFVIGPSGCGKSSLVFAGLLPQLKNSAYFDEGFWLVKQMRPGAHPLQELGTVLGGQPNSESVGKLLAANPPAQRVLLAVDQFEELFSQAERVEQNGFMAALRALRAVENCALLITMRADFYPELMNSDTWEGASDHRKDIAPLRGDALRAAIEKPAHDVGVYLERGLADRLVIDAADEPGPLPLLQETMRLLWAEMARRFLPLGTYEQLSAGNRSGLATAIANKADATLNDLPSAEHKTIARRIFLRLVQFGEGRPDIRRQQLLSSLRTGNDPRLFDETLRHLADNRLLTVTGEEKGREKRVDLAHEELIRSWPQLQQWLKDRRGAEQVRRRLDEKVREWTRLHRKGGLLDDVEIKEAEQWLQGLDAADIGADSPTLQELVAASNAAVQNRKKQEEAARQRELEQARALADEQTRSALHKAREVITFRRFAIVLGALLLISIGLLIFSSWQRSVAYTRQLIAASMAAESVDPELSVLIAANGLRSTWWWGGETVAEARQQLLHAIVQSHVKLTLVGHGGPVTAVAWNPNGKRVATASTDGTTKIWDSATGKNLLTLMGSRSEVYAVAWSPDSNGNRIATGNAEGLIMIFDSTTGMILHRFQGNAGSVLAVAWSKDGRSIFTGHLKNQVKMWDVEHGRESHTMHIDGQVGSLACNPDGTKLAAGSGHGMIVIMDLSNWRTVDTFHYNEKIEVEEDDGTSAGVYLPIYGLSWSPDGQLVASASTKGAAAVWGHIDPQLKDTVSFSEHDGMISSISWSPKGTWIASGGVDNTIKLDVASALGGSSLFSVNSEPITLVGHYGTVSALDWSPDGMQLLSGSDDGTAKIWDLSSFTTLNPFAVSSDGRVASAGGDRVLTVWDPAMQKNLLTLPPLPDLVRVLWSPNGQWLTTWRYNTHFVGKPAKLDHDDVVQLWNSSTGEEIYSWRGSAIEWSQNDVRLATRDGQDMWTVWDMAHFHKLKVLTASSVSWSPNGKVLIATDSSGLSTLWDIDALVPILSVAGDRFYWSPNSERIAATKDSKSWDIWDVRTHILISHVDGSEVKWNPDSVHLAVIDAKNRLVIYNSNDVSHHVIPEGSESGVSFVHWSSDGNRVVGLGLNQIFKIWKRENGRELVRFLAPSNATSIMWSSDDRYLAAEGGNNVVNVWDARSGEQVYTLSGFQEKHRTVRWTADAKWLVVAGFESVQIYPMSVDELIAVARLRVTEHPSNLGCKKYLHVETCPSFPSLD